MKKRLVAMILAMSMCVSMSGCGDDETSVNQVEYGYFYRIGV